MFGIKKFLFGDGPNENLPADVKAALEAWLALDPAEFESAHHLTRYVIVDIATDGNDAESNQVTALAATVMHQGIISPTESIYLDLSAGGENITVDRQLAAFLQFIGKSPLVCYHQVFVSAFLENLLKKNFGINFSARWVDLTWLLPAMFSEIHHKPMPLDDWLQAFGIDPGNGRRSPCENNLVLARLLQMLVVRAQAKGVGTVDELIAESEASSHLRRTH